METLLCVLLMHLHFNTFILLLGEIETHYWTLRGKLMDSEWNWGHCEN